MNAEDWIRRLALAPHPEGGWYRRYYTSTNHQHYPSHNATRPSASAIYYLLKAGEFSAFHKIKSDEIWHYYTGTTQLRIYVLTSNGNLEIRQLGTENGALPQQVIPAKTFFAVELSGISAADYALVGCTVSPGFDFADFELGDKADLQARYPQHAGLLDKLCI